MTGPDLEPRWQAMWAALGRERPPDGWLQRLLHAWTEPHRRYHTLEHLQECLGHLDLTHGLAAHPALVELALWFHDAVYEPGDDNNELKSAYLAERAMAAAGLDRETIGTVRRMILATRDHDHPESADEALLIDIDLAILGSPPARYDRYEDDIRAEYHSVPWSRYLVGRRAVLKRFLARPVLFWTDWFRTELDGPARSNLKRTLKRLPSSRAFGV